MDAMQHTILREKEDACERLRSSPCPPTPEGSRTLAELLHARERCGQGRGTATLRPRTSPAASRPSRQEKALRWLSSHAPGTRGLQEGDTRGALAFLGRGGSGSTNWFRKKKKSETLSPLSSLGARLPGIWLFPFWEGGSNEVSSSSRRKSSTANVAVAATAHLRPRAGRAAPRQRSGQPRTNREDGTSPPEQLLIELRK